MIPDEIKQKIDSGDYTFIDKVMSGGFGYGKTCIPDEVPQVILSSRRRGQRGRTGELDTGKGTGGR